MLLSFLDLSTSHLTPDTMGQLEQAGDSLRSGWPAMTIAPYEYGAFVTVPWTDDDPAADAAALAVLPPDLELVVRHARRLGATVVRLDSDGAELAELPTYRW